LTSYVLVKRGHFNHIQRFKMNKSVSVAKAKATLSDCILDVEAGPSVLITRHGKPVAALFRASDFHRLDRLRKADPESGLASLAGGWKDSLELITGNLRHFSRIDDLKVHTILSDSRPTW